MFRFTTAERHPIAQNWTLSQFKPGDACTITLGGQLAITGVITDRQTAYDSQNHAVQLMGKGVTWFAAKSSVLHKTGDFSGKSFEEAAKEVIKPYGVGVRTIGELDKTPFKRLQCEKGEKVWDFCERIARPRKIIMGSDGDGNFLLIGEHSGDVVDSLVEGQNILRMQCLLTIEDSYSRFDLYGQTAANDEQHGRKASEQSASVAGTDPPPRFSALVTVAEQPVWGAGELAKRAQAENQWHNGTKVEAHVTVHGWLNGSGQLWTPGDDVNVRSPMAMLNQTLSIEMVTFTQDDKSGTTTTLKLRAPWYLNDNVNAGVSISGMPNPSPAVSTYDIPIEQLVGKTIGV